MNKEYYKNTFSMVCPSEEAIERMLCMTETRKKTFRHKGLIIVLAVIAALVCGTFTVNAATDGALFDKVKIFINGDEVNPTEHIKNYKTYVDDEGRKITSFEVESSDGSRQSFAYGTNDEEDENLEANINVNDDGAHNSAEISVE